MDTIFIEVLNRSIAASWFIGAIILLRLFLRRAPRWTVCLLWGSVGIRLLSPFSIESAISLIPSSETVSPGIIYAQTPTIHTGISSLNSAVDPYITKVFAPSPMTSANPLQILSYVASLIWIAGILLMLIYALISWILLKRKVTNAIIWEKNIHICDHIPSPFILGILRPKIYIPSNTLKEDLRHILAHENAHIKRKDHLWKPLAFAILSINWFCPFIWIAYILLCRDIEAACDERVIKEMQLTDRKEYSKALLDCAVMKRRITACPLAFGELSVKGRIKKVLQYKRPSFWIILISLFLCIAVGVCFLTDPKDVPNPNLRSPFGREYIVSEIVYDAPQYSFTYTPETAPRYRLRDDMQIEILEDLDSDHWLTPGALQKHDLSYDDLLSVSTMMDTTLSPAALVDENSNAWTLDVLESNSGAFYYLLQQDNGDLYFCLGYHHAVHDHIRWIFRLEEAPGPLVSSANDDTAANTREGSSEEERLDMAVHDAIIEHNRHRSPNYSQSVFICEDHIILDTETIVACSTDSDHSYEETTLYLMVLYQEYDLSSGSIQEVGGSHMPVALTFERTDAEYILLEYWTPEDGSYYLSSIQDKFPEHCQSLALDTQLHVLGQIQNCYDQAVQFAQLDTARILNQLYAEIEASPTQASAPTEYINAHPLEFRELTYYGMHTLRHAFGEFLKGGQTNLHGHLMALVCQEILKSMGEPFEATSYETGQEWFEQFQAYAYSVEPQIVSPYSSQFKPSIHLLLNMEK